MESEVYEMKKNLFLLLCGCIIALNLHAEQNAASIGELASKASSVSPDIVKSERAVESAKRNLTDRYTLENTSISVEGGYSASTTSSTDASGFIGEASLSLPILSQLSMGGNVARAMDGEISGGISLSVSPLAADPDTYTSQKAYRTAVIHNSYLKRQVYFEAEKAVLELLVADRNRTQSRDTVELEEKTYEMLKAKMALGEAALSDVQDQLAVLSDANKKLYNDELSYTSAWKALQLMFDGETEIVPAPLSLENLVSLVEQRKARIAELENAIPSSETLETLNAELDALEAEMRATPVYRPDLSINASAGFPLASYSISVGMKFSPKEIKNVEREDLKDAIADAHIDIQTETLSLSLQKQMLRKNITIAEEAFSYAKLTSEKAERSLKESELLFEQGEYTQLELETEQLSLKSAEAELFSVTADLYTAQADYLALFVL